MFVKDSDFRSSSLSACRQEAAPDAHLSLARQRPKASNSWQAGQHGGGRRARVEEAAAARGRQRPHVDKVSCCKWSKTLSVPLLRLSIASAAPVDASSNLLAVSCQVSAFFSQAERSDPFCRSCFLLCLPLPPSGVLLRSCLLSL